MNGERCANTAATGCCAGPRLMGGRLGDASQRVQTPAAFDASKTESALESAANSVQTASSGAGSSRRRFFTCSAGSWRLFVTCGPESQVTVEVPGERIAMVEASADHRQSTEEST